MKIGLNLDAFRDEPLETIIPEVQKMNIHYVEIWASNLNELGSEKAHKWSYSNKDIDKAVSQLSDAGLKAQIVTFAFGLDPEYCNNIELFKKEFKLTIDAAKKFSAPYIIHHVRDISRSEKVDLELMHKYWDEPIEIAEKEGITLLLENEPMDMTCCPENVLSFLKEFDSPNFMCNFDASNYYLACNEPFPYCYETVKPYIKHVHIKNLVSYNPLYCPSPTLIGLDMTREYKGKKAYRVRLADGVLNNEGFLKALAKDNFEGVVSLENHGTHKEMMDMCSADAEYLRSTGLFME